MFILGSLSKLLEAALELCLPLLMANIIDIGIVRGDRGYILRMGAYLLILIVLGLAAALYCQYCAAVSSCGTGLNIRNALIERISAFSYAELDKFGTETLINRTASDVNYVQQAVAFTVRLVSRAPFLCIGAVVMSLMIDVTLTLIFLVTIPILGVILFWFMKTTSPLYTRVQKKLDRAALIVRENLGGVRVIRAFSRTKKEEERFAEAAGELREVSNHAANLATLMNPLTSMIVNLSVIAILYFGASRVFEGRLTQGNILALCTYATKILYALIVVANLVVMFAKAIVSSERINEVLNTEPSVIFPEETGADDSVSGGLPHEKQGEYSFEFNNVTFSYNGGENVLSNITFAVKRGWTLGIVGITGSGKTTLLNLLQRFYDVSGGEIKIGGRNIKEYPGDRLRREIGIVPQTGVLFSGSVAENIRWGKADAADGEIIDALKIAQAYDFISALPEGIEAQVGEGGGNFSGGQRQRLTIARAVVKRPEILIFDDSLSALDYKTDMLLRKSLKASLPASTTSVIVSQRISSVRNADKIVVLREGEISGMGTHEELLASCGHYREIYSSQFRDGEDDVKW
jgi:ATP-binding cassette subfamily B protein